jgi:hypothetical protein
MPAEKKSEEFVDRLALDLDTARLLHAPMPDVVERVRTELVTIRDALIRAFPDSAIVLTGSLSVGEGQVDILSGHPVIRSDCDLFVVSRNAGSLWPPAARRRLAAALDVIPFLAPLDIGLVWEPLLRKRLTTIGGAVMGGTLDISSILPLLPAPHAGNELLKAYQFLSAAPLHLKSYDLFCAKSLTRGARALLLHKEKGRPRSQWIGLSSVAFVKDAIRKMEPQLGSDAVDTIRRACDVILGIESGGLPVDDHTRYTAILGSIADRINLPSSRILALKHALWLLHEKRPGIPRLSVGTEALNGLRSLAEAWRPGQLDHDGIRKAEQIARHLCRMQHARIDADPMTTYAGVHKLLADLASFNPHKLYYGPRGVSI